MNTAMTSVRADRSKDWKDIASKLEAAVRSLDLQPYGAWAELDLLSGQTIVEGIRLDTSSGVKLNDDFFVVPGSVFVELNYGSNDDAVTTHDAFPIQIKFSVAENTDIDIRDIEVDTRSFYE